MKDIKKVQNWVLVVLLVGSAMLPWACTQKKKEEKTAQRNPVMVKVQAVTRGDIVQSLHYKGTVYAWKQANIQPDVSGRIYKIYKKQGDPVKKGDLLAELDTTTLKLQLKQAEASLAAAKAAYKDADMNNQRLEKLLEKDAISKLQKEKAELGLEAALTQQQSTQAAVNLIAHTLDNCYMKAPFSGTVTSKNAEEGDVINPLMGAGMNSSVLTVMNLDTVKVILDVPSEDIEKISLDQPCSVQVSTLEEKTYPGLIYSRNLAADAMSKTFKVEVKIDNPLHEIKAGVFAQVTIETSRKANCLVLPLSALNEEKDASFVVLYQNGEAAFKNIRVGERNDQLFEILEGLSEGQLVVTEGNYDLKNGAPITYTGANQ